MVSRKRIEIGDRFQQLGRTAFGGMPRGIWRVQDIGERSDRLLYARLVMESDKTMVKTIAVNALIDGRQFAAAPESFDGLPVDLRKTETL